MSFNWNTSMSNLTASSWACYPPLNSVACLRHGIVGALALITLLPVLYKIFFFHYRRHSRWHHFLIFYSAGLQLIFLFLHWLLVSHIELAFVALFLKSVQSLATVHFFCSLAAHQLRQEKVFIWVFVPALVVLFLYFIATMIYALVTVTADMRECKDTSWIQFASGEIALTIVFFLAGVQITRKINTIRMSAKSRRSQKIGLWTLIVAFFASNVCAFAVDMYALAKSNADCTQILGEENGVGNTVRYIFVRVFRYLVIIWALIPIFRVPDSSPDSGLEDSFEPDAPYHPVNNDGYGAVRDGPVSPENEGLLTTPPHHPSGSFSRFPASYLSYASPPSTQYHHGPSPS